MGDKKIYKLYALICPLENIIRYIGITSRNEKTRLKEHLQISGDNEHKNNWILLLRKKYMFPEIKVLYKNLSCDEACKLEIETIKKYRKLLGKKLTNISPGGNVPPSAKGKKRIFSEEHRKKLSNARKGKKPYNKGKKMPKEQREKLSRIGKIIRNTKKWKDMRSTWTTARIKVKLINENGDIQTVTNVYTFCLEHGIDNSSMYKMIKGKSKSCKGWKLYK